MMRYGIHQGKGSIQPGIVAPGESAADYPQAIRTALAMARKRLPDTPPSAPLPVHIVWDRTDRQVVAIVIGGQLFEDHGNQHEYEVR